MNISKAKLEGLFVDELKELQPNPGFMRLVKDHVLRAWEQREAEVCRDVDDIEQREKAIRQKLDRLDEAFLIAQSIDIETYDRHKDKLRQELTLLEIDRHTGQVEKFDVEGILAFAERVLPRASAPCGSKRRSISGSACSSCFSLTEFCSMENGLFEPV